jgi:hypothetical protein
LAQTDKRREVLRISTALKVDSICSTTKARVCSPRRSEATA